MKKFLSKIALFLLPVFLIGFLLDVSISYYLRKSNSHAQKEYPTWNAIMDGTLDSEVFVYGSSRAWVHFDPAIMQDSLQQTVYNLGIDGHGFNMQFLRHELALKYNPPPKVIIQSLDINTLGKGNLYNSDQFLPYMLWDEDFYQSTSSYEGFSRTDYVVPLIRYNNKIDALKTALKMLVSPQSNLPERMRGYQGQISPWNDDLEQAKQVMNEYVATPDTAVMSLFENYLSACKQSGIRVVLVYPPYYIEGQKFMRNQEEVLALYRQIASKHGVVFIDFSNDMICFDRNYFYNSSHLNLQGSKLFTRQICDTLKTLIQG